MVTKGNVIATVTDTNCDIFFSLAGGRCRSTGRGQHREEKTKEKEEES